MGISTHNKSLKAGAGGGGEFIIPKSRRTPSFSSTLLESIYRSIDESHCDTDKPTGILNQRRKQSNSSGVGFGSLCDEAANSRRALPAEKRGSSLSNSGSSSSDSSYGGAAGVFSSSEPESHIGEKSEKSKLRLHGFRPIRTRDASARIERSDMPIHSEERDFHSQQPKIEGRFTRTKSRALKMYGDLKKVKHPISPGGRIASFLNSIFNSGNPKKSPKSCPMDPVCDTFFLEQQRKSKSVQESVSPFSRSCLSSAATPSSSSSRGGGGGGTRRCVRFCPVSVIVNEDSQPCGHKTLYGEEPDDPSLTPIPNFVKIAETPLSQNRDSKNRAAVEKQRTADQIEAAARNYLMRGFHQKHGAIMSELGWRARRIYVGGGVEEDDREEEEEDNDTESCASSDLFELDNLVGIGRHRQELPVYETTSLKTNHAIANGLIF